MCPDIRNGSMNYIYIASWTIMLYCFMSYHIISYCTLNHIIFHFIVCHIILYYIVLCPVILYYVIFCFLRVIFIWFCGNIFRFSTLATNMTKENRVSLFYNDILVSFIILYHIIWYLWVIRCYTSYYLVDAKNNISIWNWCKFNRLILIWRQLYNDPMEK